MSIQWVVVGIVVLCLCGGVDAADCPDAGVVVVASVFATLAVVFIILGVVGFLLWKRRRELLQPDKKKHGDAEAETGEKFGYTNVAFDKDSDMVDGIPGYVPCRDDSGHKQKLSPINDRSLAQQKTWSSLPGADLPYARTRKSSAGSLDRNTYNGDESLVEVWLTSHDFIGLGFNIAGSMRDGIFVSQVHNRGPANESGRFKVGDRITSVSISFENMVYEDALTILSYASPYPVKVTLQKEQQIPKNRRLSDVRTNLNHPLYRSHSVDALNAIPKESELPSKRCTSAVRYDKRDSPQIKRASKPSGVEKNIMEETNFPVHENDNEMFVKDWPVSQVNAVVHRENSDSIRDLNLDNEVTVHAETDLPNANDDTEGQKSDSLVAGEFTDAFKNLTEEDKLDVLRLSYADPDLIPNSSFEGELPLQATTAPEQKSIPAKPERKKKRSSTNSSSASQSDVEFLGNSPTASSENIPLEEYINRELMPPTEAPPPIPTDEEIIQPTTNLRSVTIDSETITFEPVTPSKFDTSNVSEGEDRTLIDFSYSETSDLDTTLVAPSPPAYRVATPIDEDEVEESMIAPTQIHKDQSVPVNSKIFVPDDGSESKIIDIENTVTVNASGDDGLSGSAGQNDGELGDFENDIPNLDMNLNFDTDSILFKETFPSRNTKESEHGMAYDISVTELDAMGEKALEEEMSKNESNRGKGGMAFEVRDDYINGETRTTATNSVHRTASYDIRSTKDRFMERDLLSSQRPTSLKGDVKGKEEEAVGMDWSGKRLVRSGSFTDIPQDDSLQDWTNRQNLNEVDDVIEQHIQEDAKSPVLPTIKHDAFEVKDKDEMSDSDSQCRSLSSSVSSDGGEGTSPPRDTLNMSTNGEDDGLGISPDNSPLKISPISDLKSDLISTSTDLGENERHSFTVELNSTLDVDMDC